MLIQSKPRWQKLIEVGKFDQDKALLSLQISNDDIAAIRVKNFDDLAATNTATLATIKKYNSEIALKAVMHKLFYQLRDAYQFKNNLNDGQIEILCELVFDDFHYLTIADIKLCLEKGLKGQYGELYQNLDVTTVYSWFNLYFSERSQHIFEARQSKLKEAHKVDGDNINRARILRETKKALQRLQEKQARKALQRQNRETLFQTLESYYRHTGIDPETELKRLKKQWKAEYQAIHEGKGMPFDLFVTFKISQELVNINEKYSAPDAKRH